MSIKLVIDNDELFKIEEHLQEMGYCKVDDLLLDTIKQLIKYFDKLGYDVDYDFNTGNLVDSSFENDRD